MTYPFDDNKLRSTCNLFPRLLPTKFDANVVRLVVWHILYIYIFFFFACHIYPPLTINQIVLLCFGRYARTRLEVAISTVSGPPVCHIKVGASSLMPYPRTPESNLPACSPQHTLNAEHQARSARVMNLRSTDG